MSPSLFSTVTRASSQISSLQRNHCFMGLKEHQQEGEMLEATVFALMITPEAKCWPSCLRSVSVCKKLIKILCFCREKTRMTCTWRRIAEEKTERLWLSHHIWLKGIQDASKGQWERLLTVLTFAQIPLKSLNITLIQPCASAYTKSYWSFHNAITRLYCPVRYTLSLLQN